MYHPSSPKIISNRAHDTIILRQVLIVLLHLMAIFMKKRWSASEAIYLKSDTSVVKEC
jgi:hypothetical protein